MNMNITRTHLTVAMLSGMALLGCDNPNSTMSDRSTNGTTTTGTTTTGTTTNGTTKTAVDRDNSGVNKRDRDTNAKTPIDQNENKVDIGITASIRKSVVDTKMSTNAQNVKIITQDGNVTLRGPVKTEEEKTRIEEIARNVAGVKAVDSQLEVEQNR